MVNERNILMIGITGHGKSTLANVLVGKEICKESAGGASETKNFQKGEFEWEFEREGVKYKYKYHVIDNIGFGDNRGISEEVILYEIGKSIYAAKEGIDQVFFVFRGKFSQEQIKSFKLFEKLILESGITKFTTLVRTNFENFRNSDKCKEDQQALLSESNIIREIIESCNGIIHVDNSPIPVIAKEDNQQETERKTKEITINEKKRKKSREKVLKHLEEKRQERQQKHQEEVYKLKEWDNIYSIVKKHIEEEKEIDEEAKNEVIAEIKRKLAKELSEINNLTAAIEQNTQK